MGIVWLWLWRKRHADFHPLFCRPGGSGKSLFFWRRQDAHF